MWENFNAAAVFAEAKVVSEARHQWAPGAFKRLWKEQDGMCAICRVEMQPGGQQANSVCRDHCHATGKGRGLLCVTCNILIGMAHDDPRILRSAADYLDEHASECVQSTEMPTISRSACVVSKTRSGRDRSRMERNRFWEATLPAK